jgi:hypothetical protein
VHPPRRHRSPRLRRSHFAAALLLVVAWPAGTASPVQAQLSEPPPPDATLDRTLVDVAALGDGPRGVPRLLTVEAARTDTAAGTTSVRLATIQGDIDGWRTIVEHDVAVEELRDVPIGTPWIVGLDPARIALLVPVLAPDRTLLVGLHVAAEGALEETGRQVIDATIDDAGAADIDGDGSQDLVLASAQTLRAGGTCQGSTIRTLSGGLEGTAVAHPVEGLRLAGGVLGHWDDRPGEDLLAYAYPNCPAGPDDPTRAVRVVLRLTDGALVRTDEVGGDRLEGLPWLGPPVRLDIDGTGLHEAISMTPSGLAIVDPGDQWAATPLSERLGFPVALGPLAAGLADGRVGPTQVAWLDLGGPDAVATATVERGEDGTIAVLPGHRPGATRDPRSDPVVIEAIGALGRGSGVWAWQGELTEPGCPVILVPGTASRCGTGDSERGPIWIGTRPLLAHGLPDQPRLVVAAGMVMNPANAYPATPSPWAAAPTGGWRHGPSAPFVLGDLAADTLSVAGALRAPVVEIPDPVVRDGRVEITGPAGVRVFVLVDELGPRTDGLDPAPGWGAFVPVDGEAGPLVLRLPAPTDGTANVGSSSVGIGLPAWDSPRPAQRWSLSIAAIDDRGTLARPIVAIVERDADPPSLDLPVPFLSAVWPVDAHLAGRSEPGARVTLEGLAEVTADSSGVFTVEMPLAPWPQTLRLVARDPAGNETRTAVSVVGGVDYRQLPWVWILGVALVLAAVISGLRGARSRGGEDGATTAGRAGEDVGFELEELPPRTPLG